MEVPLEPKDGDALIGGRGAVLSGSKVLHGWREKGKVVLENLKQAGIVPKDLADKAAALA